MAVTFSCNLNTDVSMFRNISFGTFPAEPTPIRMGQLLVKQAESQIEKAFAAIKTFPVVLPEREKLIVKRMRRNFPKEDATIEPQIVAQLTVPPTKQHEAPLVKGVKQATSVKQRKPSFKRKIVKNGNQIQKIIDQVIHIMKRKCGTIDIAGSSGSVRFKKTDYGTLPLVRVRHMARKLHTVDLAANTEAKKILQRISEIAQPRYNIETCFLKRGDSGLLIKKSRILGAFVSDNALDFIVVRGRSKYGIVDAVSKVSCEILRLTVHYSLSAQYFDAFSTEFLKHRVVTHEGPCERDIPLQTIGKLHAQLYQLFFTSGKITCLKCMNEIARRNGNNFIEPLLSGVNDLEKELCETSLPHVQALMRAIAIEREKRQIDINVHADVLRIVNGREGEIFKMISRLNDALSKSGFGDQSALKSAHIELLQIARWCKNRSDINQSGSLQNFRNKISGKAHVNTALMCDNQLDTNGNFLWGKRGYHAKRFFANYFEKIDPRDGYVQHRVRKSPNGERELAIGNLLMSTNFEVLRQQLKGNAIESMGITEACVSKLNNNFLYSCCCATLDDGKPVLSDLKIPTKNHLVIGNTGDAKYVDLPTNDDEHLYIAKDGYCYVNIFLAMLVNVSEKDAKEFTKTMVRDLVVPKLGKWPKLIDVATACHLLSVFFPDTRNAELPRILVDHTNKTMHVVDSYGSLTTGYHVLKATTVNQLIGFASDELQSEMKDYYVGGGRQGVTAWDLTKVLIKGIYRPAHMREVIEQEPCLLALAILSPHMLMALFNSGSFDQAAEYWMGKDDSIVRLVAILEMLTKKVSMARLLVEQHQILEQHAQNVFNEVFDGFRTQMSYHVVTQALLVMKSRCESNEQLGNLGFFLHDKRTLEIFEKNYCNELAASWNELSWLEKLYASWQWSKAQRKLKESFVPLDEEGSNGVCRKSLQQFAECVKNKCKEARVGCCKRVKETCKSVRRKCIRSIFSLVNASIPDLIKVANLLAIITLLMGIINQAQIWLHVHQKYKMQKRRERQDQMDQAIHHAYLSLKQNDQLPTVEQFEDVVRKLGDEIWEHYETFWKNCDVVKFQAKNQQEQNLEKIIAFVTLLSMLYSTERSDSLFKILNKVKGVLGTIEGGVYHQLDDIQDIISEKNLTIDFSLDNEKQIDHTTFDVTFGDWWQQQLNTNRVVSHYRTGGYFMEFTRATCLEVCNKIQTTAQHEFLIRGGVGSGKSTGLPFHLSSKGQVLIIEPTRPLAENVCKQLKNEPFLVHPTLRMRGLVTCGSDAIDVMTSGYALHYLANARNLLNSYAYIIFDECHVLDSSAMAFYSLLKEMQFSGKILKVSATPPGRETEFTTMKTVSLATEESISFEAFVRQQGTGSNVDVVSKGDNILVYVASYNEVDCLSKLLTDKGYSVTKVDGRTMKVGNVEIRTRGSPLNKHFVVATNIIENGVTLDIDVVVDFGVKVCADIDIDNRMMVFKKTAVSYGERIQRLGRVGRVKEGHALRIGHTEKGITDIPTAVATDAAFLCFVYGLPVMTHNVTTSLLSNCTRKQATTMMQFEISPYFTVGLVRFNGTMHPIIHDILKQYKLRDSEIHLSTLAVPYKHTGSWITASQYRSMGAKLELPEGTRLPFYLKDIPDKVYEKLWKCVIEHRGDAGFGRLTTHCAAKVAYTLSTDPVAIPRTVTIINALIAQEQEKQAYFKTLQMQNCSVGSFSLASIANALRSRYAVDHTGDNIEILQRAKAQLLDFAASPITAQDCEVLANYGVLHVVQHQNNGAVSRALGLKGKWNGELLTRDLFVNGCVLSGGIWMIWQYFKGKFGEEVSHQGMGKRQRQKLKFRNTALGKLGREVHGDDGTIEHHFGEAYTAKGKAKGKHGTRGMGTKTRHFMNIYGFDPSEYTIVRYLDPLTGATQDENPLMAIDLVQERFAEIRSQLISEDKLERQAVKSNPGIQAFYMKNKSDAALKVDLTPHNPLLVTRMGNIAGFPENEFVLRQTGKAQNIKASDVPESNCLDDVEHEGKNLNRGLRDYNVISSVVCRLTNESDGHSASLYGLGYGGYIITNRHLFKNNNGTLKVQSQHGDFVVKNTTQLKMTPVGKTDILIIRMPKDFPVLPRRLRFRAPSNEDKVCLIASNFQERYVSSLVSETSSVYPVGNGEFWQHWISTKDGHCGLPLTSTRDGFIIGIHSLSTITNSKNFFASIPSNFEESYLDKLEQQSWISNWKYNPNEVSWNGLKLQENKPDSIFKAMKEVSSLFSDSVYEQGQESGWLFRELKDNLKAVAILPNQLVTKHVVKGPCQCFMKYLNETPEAETFFRPLMGHYSKSILSKEAFVRDIMKYSKPIVLGEVDFLKFEEGYNNVVRMFRGLGFETCQYVTDGMEIYKSLNLKAAVGAMYTGKKQQYFEGMSEEAIQKLVEASCFRLWSGKFGLWNGSLKAELRPIEKVRAGKTRTFTAAPLDTLLGAKVCVDDFNAQFYAKHIQAPWTVGICKYYRGWDEFMAKLPTGWLYCDADGSQFDSSLTPFLINSVLRLRLEFMEEWDIGEQMLSNLYTEIIYTPIATPDGTVVKKFRGNNSGQPSTVVDNTLMVVLAMNYSLAKLNIPFEAMDSRIRYFANGDDLIIAVNPVGGEQILDSLQDSFSELGLNYDFNDRTYNKEQLSFMSHQALWDGDMYIPKIKAERVVSILEWDRSVLPEHRIEAVCAAMIEAWGFPNLLQEIRKFYAYMVTQEPYSALHAQGQTRYISEQALITLYKDRKVILNDIEPYLQKLAEISLESGEEEVWHQAESMDAGGSSRQQDSVARQQDKDVNVGTFSVARVKQISDKMMLPRVRGKAVLNLQHLIQYSPEQTEISNTRATRTQFDHWYDKVKESYGVTDDQMSVILNGLMVWCIENGTSPNLHGNWTMMDGEEQVEYPLQPILENAQPTFRQIMAHFSNAAEAYIEKRNSEQRYMPRYGNQRNLNDYSLARYAFDFYEMTSRTPNRAREAHIQMKAAALRNTKTKLFGLDGKVGTEEEDTERHTASDVRRDMHSLLGVSM
uniref:Genome polyprotein n=1 Tax=Ornithogalum mosaic virus TaxID=12204 RepID=A0A678T6H9_OMV|nr:MAG: polyprotein [Ornithogalum mosaic virus]